MSEESSVKYCPLCGTALIIRSQFREGHLACPACGWIYYADPKVAAAVLVEQNNRVLLTRRVNEPAQGMWSLPAGFVNAYEDPARAAERECLEETGLLVSVTGLVDVVSGREHRRGADIVIIYRAELRGGSLRAGDDADQAAFFDRQELPPLAFRATRLVLGEK
ncbi:MAG TPA: NUDIX domain-containing protein [Anaerolineaceae bacterium]|nr:NUDIX domain-containing protein [Anaerolineaceae bacterium]